MVCSRISSQNECGRRSAKESSGKPGKAHPREAGINATGVNGQIWSKSGPLWDPDAQTASCKLFLLCLPSPHHLSRERKLIEKAD